MYPRFRQKVKVLKTLKMASHIFLSSCKVGAFCALTLGIVILALYPNQQPQFAAAVATRSHFWKYYKPPPIVDGATQTEDQDYCPNISFMRIHLDTEGTTLFDAIDFTVSNRILGSYPVNSVMQGHPRFEYTANGLCRNVEPVPIYQVTQLTRTNRMGRSSSSVVLRGAECWASHDARTGHFRADTIHCRGDPPNVPHTESRVVN